MILVSETAHGFGASFAQLARQQRPLLSVRIINDLRKIEAEIRALKPGDIFMAMLVEMEPGGVFDAGAAVRIITRLENELLPKEVSAILLDTQMFSFQKEVAETIELCMGRIEIHDSPAMAEQIFEAIDRLSTI